MKTATARHLVEFTVEQLKLHFGPGPHLDGAPELPHVTYRERQHPRVPRGQPGAGQWARKAPLHLGPGPHPDGTPQAVHGGGAAPAQPTGRNVKTLYHGTKAPRFEAFNPGKPKRIMQLGFGIHFTEDKDFANDFYGKGKGGRVITAQVDLGRMLDAEQIVVEGSPEFALAEKIAKTSRKRLPIQHDMQDRRIAYMASALDLGSPPVVERALREAGYDSVKYQARVTGGGWVPAGYQLRQGDATSYVVLDPARIKIVQHQ